MKKRITLACALLCMSMTAAYAEEAELTTEQQQFSYVAAFQFIQHYKSQGIPLDEAAVVQAIKDTMAGGELKLTPQEMQAVFQSFQQKRAAQLQAIANENLKMGQEFLEKNKDKEGITSLDSGIQYKVLNKGSGKSPSVTDTVSVHYRGTLINGLEFDSSYKRGEPVTFGLGNVIRGWQEILPLMKEGDKWQVFIPSDLAYGPPGRPGSIIGPNSTLIFDIELMSVAQ